MELRTAERVFIKSFHSFQKLTGEELEFPFLSSVDEMLEWVKRMIFLGDISDAFAAGIAGECLSEICAFFCRDGVCSDILNPLFPCWDRKM